MQIARFQRGLERLAGALGSAARAGTSGVAEATEARQIEHAVLGSERAPSSPAFCADAPAADDVRRARIDSLQGMIDRVAAQSRARLRERPAIEPAPALPLRGTLEDTPLGPLHRHVAYLEPAHCHGRVAIARALAVSAQTMASITLDASIARIDPRRMLLLDTETTGLSGGTGTLPFLVGLAWFEDESLCIEQLLLRRPGEERPILARLAERVEAASCIVTYNGKSFDWPLLRTRAVMNRVALPAPRAHVDLLHAARRLVGPRLSEVRLTTMERDVLGMLRAHDVDGAEIPGLFWDFVRGAAGGVLTPVMEHNANDVIALAGILVALAERWDGVLPSHAPEDRLAVARTALRLHDLSRAHDWARAAADGGGSESLTAEALTVAATARRRGADPRAARALLEEALVSAPSLVRSAIHLALAKLCERRLADPATALVHARAARTAEPEDASARRIARLEARIVREAERAAKRAARAARARRRAARSQRPDAGD